MAQKIEIQKNLIDAAIVVGGAGILQTYVVEKVAAIGNLLGNLPDVMGISLGAIVLGTVSLIVVKTYLMK